MKKFTSVLTLLSTSIALAACGGGGGGSDDAVAEQDLAIRGVINQILPSGVVPSAALPSVSLPSVEVGNLTDAVEEIIVTLERDQEVGVEPFENPNANQNLTASAELSVNTSTGVIEATVTALGLDAGDIITMVHIHDGFAGNNGPVPSSIRVN